MAGDEGIPLNRIGQNNEEQQTRREDPFEGPTSSIDVNSLSGLITILTVNFHQLETLINVGPDLGYKFYLNIVFVSVSICFACALIFLKHLPPKTGERSNCFGSYRDWVIGVLIFFVFLSNLALQITTDLKGQCTVLMNQPLPPI
ncbi:uncharacterized protein LOC128721700 [Anopheles nili]|uniref:uncharacterized protein LOC128721700 n=1 Tax=Anopheles nili TaxID=185578 RepID=UPI00237A1DF6|nr:uncharacterized protein LOC128721700 [Anopheles nili]